MKYTSLTLALLISSTAFAQRTVNYPSVYPFIPEKTSTLYTDVRRVTEDPEFIRNFNDIQKLNLNKANTPEKPWTASYWPLSKGTIADAYENNSFGYFLDVSWIVWENNYKGFKKRLKKKLSKVDSMSEEELEKLAPSEKYDLLLGDKNFELTQRLWEYMHLWGSEKQNSFIKEGGIHLTGTNALELAQNYVERNFYTSIEEAFMNSWNLKPTLSVQKALELVRSGRYSDVTSAFAEAQNWAMSEAPNYVLQKKSSRIAAWEGICNGWSTAAGLVPRPRKAVSFKLPNGKNLKFYPDDIKGLISLYYVNSLIQDPAIVNKDGEAVTQGTVSAGLRCNLKNPKRDTWGRYYDDKSDPFSLNQKLEVRCNGVHPATWHLGLVNLIGKQGRSFVVDRKVGHAIDNHPMYGYQFAYFNPNTGKSEKKLDNNIEMIDEEDQFKQFRNPRARYIVGVEATITYLNYDKPKRKETNSEKDDEEVDKTMLYDLELDENFDIVGGQWRAYKVGEEPDMNERRVAPNLNQPDFFWAVTKNYKSTGWFGDLSLEPWSDKSKTPPASWVRTARQFHSFMYQKTVANGAAGNCQMKNKKTKKLINVVCEFEENRPQPLVNVINTLVELSKN